MIISSDFFVSQNITLTCCLSYLFEGWINKNGTCTINLEFEISCLAKPYSEFDRRMLLE